MERALLEGEHQMEMEELEREQQTINRLKHRQLELIDQATAEREKVRKKNDSNAYNLFLWYNWSFIYLILTLLFFSFDPVISLYGLLVAR